MKKEGKDSDDEDLDQAKVDDIEMKEIEKLIKTQHTNYSKISDHYKLFEIVAKNNPEQVLRFVNYREEGLALEPLWASEKNIIETHKINKCDKCG